MYITSRGITALKLMQEIGRYPIGSPTRLRASDLSETLNTPPAFSVQLLNALGTSGLLTSRRGINGGYTLSRPAEEINVLDILLAVGEQLEIAKSASDIYTNIAITELVNSLKFRVYADLQSYTLYDLVHGKCMITGTHVYPSHQFGVANV